MPTWSEGFAAQASSDLDVYEALAATPLPASHRLHYLQMWLEKLCKSYLWLPTGVADELRMRHNVIEAILPRMIREHWRRIGFQERPDITAIRALCREIDLLHPQVDDNGQRRDNVEYPWLDAGGNVVTPMATRFHVIARLYSHTGRLLMKAAVALTRQPRIFVPH